MGGALWQIYETLYLLFRVQECRFITPSQMQECRFTTPSQDAGILVLSMRDGRLTLLPFRAPDPTGPPLRQVPNCF
jgi:hypothetical protein